VGKPCRSASITEVAEELRLNWHTVEALDQLYMQAQLDAAGAPAPAVIGIEEISMRNGHVYRTIVSDREWRRPIWFGGVDRSAGSMV